MNILKNPHFILDSGRDTLLNSTLDVFAQILLDACNDSSEQRLTPIFATDVQRFRQAVVQFYARIQSQSPMDEHLLMQEMHSLSEVSFSFGKFSLFP